MVKASLPALPMGLRRSNRASRFRHCGSAVGGNDDGDDDGDGDEGDDAISSKSDSGAHERTRNDLVPKGPRAR